MSNALAGKLTITFDVFEQPLDRRQDIDWETFMSILGRHMPAHGSLPVKDGLSDPITFESVWGNLKVSYDKVPTIEDI